MCGGHATRTQWFNNKAAVEGQPTYLFTLLIPRLLTQTHTCGRHNRMRMNASRRGGRRLGIPLRVVSSRRLVDVEAPAPGGWYNNDSIAWSRRSQTLRGYTGTHTRPQHS